MQSRPEVTPERIFKAINAYQSSAALKAAIELGLFTAIGGQPRTVREIAEQTSASEKGIRVLSDFLVVEGFLSKRDGRYSLSPESAFFLDKNSPAFMGTMIEFLLSPLLTAGFTDVRSAVVKGGTTVSPEGTMEPNHPIWVDFARSMAPLFGMPAEIMAGLVNTGDRPLKVLDIAAGHGLFGIAIGKQNPNARIVALDWPRVTEYAQANAAAAGIQERYSVIAGSAFEVDFGKDYDLILLTNFLHHFSAATCEKLLRKVHAALKSDGRAATLEFVPNDDRVSPAVPAQFALIMLATTAEGDAYTFAELDRMFRNAGFSRNEQFEVVPTFQTLVVSNK